MKLPVFLKHGIGSKPGDEKNFSLEMSSGHSEEQSSVPRSSTPSRSYRQPIAKVCYLLSFAVGAIGTYFAVRSQTSNDTEMPNRVLYSFTLMSAGILLEVAREAILDNPPASTTSSPQAMDSLSLDTQEAQEHDTLIEEEKKQEEKTDSALALDLVQQDSTSLSVSSPRSPSQTDLSTLPEDCMMSAKTETSEIATTKQPAVADAAKPTGAWRLFSTSMNLLSVTWFGQAFSLFVRNAIVESSSSHLLPYTTLIGLATGHLFHACIKPWRLGGVRDWIIANRNFFAAIEMQVFLGLPQMVGKDFSLYYYTVSAFWSGFNFNDGTSFIIKKFFNKKLQANEIEDVLIDREIQLEVSAYNWRSGLTTMISGGTFTTASILLLQYIADDQTGFRNIFAKFLSAIGCYLLTYPLGVKLGQKIPARYHHNTLEVCTYLLIPLASPDLSILHLIAMTGAGICGGVAHYIMDTRYKKRLAAMRERIKEIEVFMKKSPVFTKQLLDLPLPEDWLLINTRKRNQKLKRPARLIYVIFGITALATQSLWKKYSITIGLIISYLLLPIINDLALPKYYPSIYKDQEIFSVLKFFYLESFSYLYVGKILAFLGVQGIYDSNGNFLLLQSIISPGAILSINLEYLAFLMASIKAGKKFYGGYIPYFPSKQEIAQLAFITELEKMKPFFKDVADYKSHVISLNYHLLQFMKENMRSTIHDKADTLNNSESADLKTIDINPCLHPLKALSLFSIPNRLPANTDNKMVQISIPLASVQCRHCSQDIMQINSDFNQRSQKYTESRFDISFITSATDAVIRGNALARQFTFGLPAGLSLAEGVKSFSI